MKEKLKVLVVDDNKDLLEIIGDCLLKNGYQTKCASNPAVAMRMLKRQGFNAIITDIQMPGTNGIEFSKQIRTAHINIPIIAISGAHISKEINAELAQLNIKQVLSKPFETSTLLTLLEELIKENNKENCFIELEKANITHIGFPIDRFTSSLFLKYDRFIKIRKDKYVRIAKANDPLCKDRILNYKNKGGEKIYLTKEDYDDYSSGYMSIIKEIAQDEKLTINKEEKIKLIAETTEIIYNQFYYEGITPKLVSQARECVSYTINLMYNDNLSFKIVCALSNQPDYLYAHSLGVSYFASMIAKSIEITKKSSILDISLGGLFHDIGKIGMNPKIYSKPSHQLTKREKLLLKRHPQIGSEMLRNCSNVSSTVSSIVLQHHESCSGGGYPLGLYSHKICMPAKIIHLASDFCNLIIENPRYRKMNPRQAINQLRKTNYKEYDKQVFKALERCFGIY